MKMKRIVAAAMAAAMGLGLLTACGGGNNDSSNASSSGDSGTLNVKIWDSTQLEGIRQICEEWSAESGVDVAVEVVNWDNYWTLLEAGASGGQMPDVF